MLAAAERLVGAFAAGDVTDYFDCFDPDATFVFHTSPRRLDSRAEYQNEWSAWERDDGFRVVSCRSSGQQVQLYGDLAVFTHDVDTVVSTSAGEDELRERETIVFRRTQTGWLAVHEHLSPRPS